MRHGKKFNHLGRKKGHRRALLSNMAISLIEHKRINTTLAKAKALRHYVEPLITKAKANTTHARRTVFSYLQNKEAIQELFGTVREKVGDRPGGYVRVIRTGVRPGDGAETAMIELVDFNTVYTAGADAKGAGSKRRTRRGRGKGTEVATAAKAEATAKTSKAKKVKDEEE
jgi:large subunit ribosomal protein L17